MYISNIITSLTERIVGRKKTIAHSRCLNCTCTFMKTALTTSLEIPKNELEKLKISTKGGFSREILKQLTNLYSICDYCYLISK